MAYDNILANRVRDYLYTIDEIKIEEKKMFGGLAFMVNDKRCPLTTASKAACLLPASGPSIRRLFRTTGIRLALIIYSTESLITRVLGQVVFSRFVSIHG